MKIFLIYLLLMNIAGFAAMGIDKCKAKAHAWRIPEKTLFGLSRRKRRYLGWDVCLQAQDKALVFCKGDAAYFLYPCGYCMCYLQEFLLEISIRNLIILGNKILNVGKK